MKTMSCLVAAMVVMLLLAAVPSTMAGAYSAGEGSGYASCASTELLPSGAIFYFTRMLPDVRPSLYNEIDRLQCAVLFRFVFGPAAYCPPGRRI